MVEPDAASCSSSREVAHRLVVEFDTTIDTNGRITVGPISDEDWERVGEKIMAIITALASDNPIVVSDCLDPQRVKAMARALAARTLGGGR